MEYNKFVEEYISQIEKIMSAENVSIIRMSVHKVNEIKDAINVKFPNEIVSPTIYVDDEYKLFLDGYSIEDIVERKVEDLKSVRANAPNVPDLSAESAKKNLYCVVINAEANKDLLKTVPHEKLQDLAIIARFRVGNDASFIVKNEMCKYFQMTAEEVMEQAHKNTEKQMFVCKNMTDVLREILSEQGLSDDYMDELLYTNKEKCPMYVVNSESNVDGAVALISTNVMEKSFEKIREDYPDMQSMYVLGSSRHELILMPDIAVDDVKDIERIHKEVQNTELKECDKLTENVYRFDIISKQLSIANKPVLAESELKELVKTCGRSR